MPFADDVTPTLDAALYQRRFVAVDRAMLVCYGLQGGTRVQGRDETGGTKRVGVPCAAHVFLNQN